MVARCYCLLGGWSTYWLLAQQDQPLWTRLEPRDRARVLAAILVLLVLCFGLIALVVWGSRWTRRYMNRQPARFLETPKNPVSRDDWADKPLHSADEDSLDER